MTPVFYIKREIHDVYYANKKRSGSLGLLVPLGFDITAFTPAAYRRRSLRRPSGRPNLGEGFALRCFQRLSRPHLDTRRCSSAPQPVNQRCVHPGPLVLRTGLRKSPAPTTDRDRTVSRRSEPSSRATADIEVPNRSVDLSSWERSACYPRSTFYPLSDGPPMRNHRITLPCFRT